jgi:ribonuclease PH
MKDMIVSCCSGLFSEESILDLLSEEEKQESIANIILAYQHMHKSISFIHTSNTKINSKSLQILLECCIEGCKRIHKIMKQNIKKHIKLSKIL